MHLFSTVWHRRDVSMQFRRRIHTRSEHAFSFRLPPRTEDGFVPVVVPWCDPTMYCALSARPSLSADLSPCTNGFYWHCTVVMQQQCDNATWIIFISTTTTTLTYLLNGSWSMTWCGLRLQHQASAANKKARDYDAVKPSRSSDWTCCWHNMSSQVILAKIKCKTINNTFMMLKHIGRTIRKVNIRSSKLVAQSLLNKK